MIFSCRWGATHSKIDNLFISHPDIILYLLCLLAISYSWLISEYFLSYPDRSKFVPGRCQRRCVQPDHSPPGKCDNKLVGDGVSGLKTGNFRHSSRSDSLQGSKGIMADKLMYNPNYDAQNCSFPR